MAKYNNSDIVTRAAIAAGTKFAAAVAPQYLAGAALNMTQVESGTLSALCVVDAETNTLTISHEWQVSNDAATWVTCSPSNNAATVVIATGTSGADPAVTVNIEANQGVYGYRFARIRLVTGVATADGSADVGGATYNFRRPRW